MWQRPSSPNYNQSRPPLPPNVQPTSSLPSNVQLPPSLPPNVQHPANLPINAPPPIFSHNVYPHSGMPPNTRHPDFPHNVQPPSKARPPPSFSSNVQPPQSFSTHVQPPQSFSTNVGPPPSFSANVRPPPSFSSNVQPPSFSTHAQPPQSFSTHVHPPQIFTNVKPLPSFSANVQPPPSFSHVQPPPSFSTDVKPPPHLSPNFSTRAQPSPSFATNVQPPPSFSTLVPPPNVQRPSSLSSNSPSTFPQISHPSYPINYSASPKSVTDVSSSVLTTQASLLSQVNSTVTSCSRSSTEEMSCGSMISSVFPTSDHPQSSGTESVHSFKVRPPFLPSSTDTFMCLETSDTIGAIKGRLRQMHQQRSNTQIRHKTPRWTVSLPQFRKDMCEAAEAVVAAAERISQIRQEASEMSEEEWSKAVEEIQSLQECCTAVEEKVTNIERVNEAERKLKSIKKRRVRQRKRKDADQLAASKWAARVATITQEAELWREAKKEADRKALEQEECNNQVKRRLKELSRRERLASQVSEKMDSLRLLRGLRRMEAETKGQLFSAEVDEEFEAEMTRLTGLLDVMRDEQTAERRILEAELNPSIVNEDETAKEDKERQNSLRKSLFGDSEVSFRIPVSFSSSAISFPQLFDSIILKSIESKPLSQLFV